MTTTKLQRQLSTLAKVLIPIAITLAAIVLLTSCSTFADQQAIINTLPPGPDRQYAELQLLQQRQQAQANLAVAVSTAAANLAAPGTALNPYYV
jgi:hypothetical protein